MIDIADLDDLGFDDLVEQGRGLIPRYAPDWTDHNHHDPGMTLLDLLAWFVDQQIYRVGFVGDAHVAAFAALLGIRPKAAVPARGLVWARRDAVVRDRPLPAGRRANPLDQPGLPFATSHEVHLAAARIRCIEVRRRSGTRRLEADETGALLLDDDSETLDLILDPPLEPGDAPLALGLAYAGPLPDPAEAPVRIEAIGTSGRRHRTVTNWVSAGSGPTGAAGAALVRLPTGVGPIARLRLELDAGLPRRMLPRRIAFNAIPIVQIARLPDRKIGEASGWPDFECPFELDGGTVPEAEEGFARPAIRSTGKWGQRIEWRSVEDFSASGPTDPAFVLDQVRQVIVCGNGINGRAPSAGEEIFRGPLDVTLGARGNLAARAGWTVAGLAAPDGGPFGHNLDPVAGGSDAWSRDDLLAELRRRARLREAMLTDAELVAAAAGLAGYGVEHAEALARYHPALPNRQVAGARTLLLRAGRGTDPSDAWLDAVERALAPRRVLGERLVIAAVTPVDVDVTAVLLVAAGSDLERIRGQAELRLGDRLAIVRRREDQQDEPWPSGRPVTTGELETLLAAVEGVVAVADLRIARVGKPSAKTAISLARTEAARAAGIDIRFELEG